jgi:PAS domain S-box-containing protein
MSKKPKPSGPEAVEDRFGNLFGNMTEGCALHEILIDAKGRPVDYRFLELNPAFESLTGLRRADALGKRVREILPGIEPFWIETYGSVALTGEPVTFERHFPAPLDRWYQVYAYRPAPRQFVAIFMDVSARKKSEEERARSEQRVFEILKSIQDDFYVLDRDWIFRFANRQFTSKIGKEPEDFIGKNIWEMFPKHLGTVYEENLRAAMDRRETRRFEIEGKYTNASYRMTAFPSAEGITVLGVDVTAQKKIERELVQNEERLKLAQASAGAGVWDWDIPSNTLKWSDEFYRLFGLDPRKDAATFETWRAVLHPEDRDEAEKRILAAVAGHESLANEYRIVLPFGEIRWIQALGNTVYGPDDAPLRMSGLCLDITERKRTQALREALADQESLKMGAAVEQAADAVIMLDLGGSIRYVNAAFESMNKVPRGKAKGRAYLEDFADPSSAGAVREALMAGKAWQGRMSRLASDGQPVELQVAVATVKDPAGTIIGVLVTERDVTQETILQRQLRRTQKMEALGTLAGGIAHDFNNILNPIFISMELALLDPSLDPAVRGHLEVGLKAAERGRDLVKQVISFSRQKEKDRKPIRIGTVVREALNFLRASLPSTIEIRADIRDEASCVLGDPANLHQLVMNLSSNAAYAMRTSGGILSIGLSAEEIDAEGAKKVVGLAPGSYLRLTVADTGVGMTPEVREKLFDPFFTTKPPGEGSGMGLPVVDGIVRDYGGAIEVESRLGQGSTFTIFLPRVGVEEAPAVTITDELPRGSGRILVLDDEEAQVYSVRGVLEKLGYEVEAFTDGRHALERIRSDPEAFDLVITDQTMPRLSGLQVAAEMFRVRPELPIILCTGFSEVADAKAAYAAGIREFLMKPYSVREMAEAVKRTVAPLKDPRKPK